MGKKIFGETVLLCITSILIAIMVFSHAESGYAAARGVTKKDKPSIESIDYNSVFFIKKKDPILAGMLSWYIPGLGQYYSGEFTRGTLFLVTEYTLAITAIFYFLNFDFAAGGDSGFSLKVDAKRTDLGVVETSRRNVFLGILTLVGIIHIYNISDAVISARKFNERLDRRRQKYKERYPSLEFGYDSRNGVYLGLQKRI